MVAGKKQILQKTILLILLFVMFGKLTTQLKFIYKIAVAAGIATAKVEATATIQIKLCIFSMALNSGWATERALELN